MIQALLTFLGLSAAGGSAFITATIEPEDRDADALGGLCIGGIVAGAVILTLARFA